MKVRNNKNNATEQKGHAYSQGDTSRLPVDATTGQPLAPCAQPGYYPGFQTLSQQAFWDEATRKVVLARVKQVPPIRFFTPEEAQLMQAVCDRLLPQDDRDEAHKIPVVNYIDERLYSGRIDGYRFEDMPPDNEAHRLGLQAIAAIARHMYNRPFIQLGQREQDSVLQSIHDCKRPAGGDIWKKMSVQRFWMLLMQDVVDAYYAHPYAWERLARAGLRVVGMEAGPFWETERDWVSDEAGSSKLYWNDLRITGGEDPITLGANNSGHGVGGGSVHWAGFTPRFHPSDFHVLSSDGLGADWPISYEEIKPYYELLEKEIPVSGPAYYPWGEPHGYIYGPHPLGGVGDVLVKGCTQLGIPVVAGGPVAILAGSHGDRQHCIYRGFCIQGCKVGAKQSTLISHVPDAIRHGAEIRANCMVARINMKNGKTTGVSYFDPDGNERELKAKMVIVSGYAIETPRLLLNSACPGFEQGLANSSGTVGKSLMVQSGNVVLGRFENPIRMYKAPPAHALTEEFYETNPKNDVVRGFAIQTVGPLPIAFAKQMMVAKGAWGWGMRRVMMDYNHWAALGVLGEILPWEDNRVELADETDQFGLRWQPASNTGFSQSRAHHSGARGTDSGLYHLQWCRPAVQPSRDRLCSQSSCSPQYIASRNSKQGSAAHQIQ